MDVVIRPYDPADLEAVVTLWLASWDSTEVMVPGTSGTVADLCLRLPKEIARGWEVHVAVLDGAIVGFCGMTEDRLKQLFIAPNRQGLGVGKLLLDFVKQQRPGGFTLSTAVNSRAWKFYEREGLARIGTKNHAHYGFPMYRYGWLRT